MDGCGVELELELAIPGELDVELDATYRSCELEFELDAIDGDGLVELEFLGGWPAGGWEWGKRKLVVNDVMRGKRIDWMAMGFDYDTLRLKYAGVSVWAWKAGMYVFVGWTY